MAKKKTKWPKLPSYSIPLFQCANVYLCRTREEWNLACAAMECEGSEMNYLSGAAQYFFDDVAHERLYLLGVFNDRTETLVHECAHIIFSVCRDVGVSTTAGDANETYCYLLDRLFQRFAPELTQTE